MLINKRIIRSNNCTNDYTPWSKQVYLLTPINRATLHNEQVALLWQRDRATRLSVEILQLQNIPFEN